MPGCLNGAQDDSKTDYCIYEPSSSPIYSPSLAPQAPSQSPTTQNPSIMPSPAPQVAPSSHPGSPQPSNSPSYAPTASPVQSAFPTAGPTATAAKELVSYGGTPPASKFPLQQCEGDCDLDSDVSPITFLLLVDC